MIIEYWTARFRHSKIGLCTCGYVCVFYLWSIFARHKHHFLLHGHKCYNRETSHKCTARVQSMSLIRTLKKSRVLFDSVLSYFTFNSKYFYTCIILGFSSFKWYINDLFASMFSQRNQRSTIVYCNCRN